MFALIYHWQEGQVLYILERREKHGIVRFRLFLYIEELSNMHASKTKKDKTSDR